MSRPRGSPGRGRARSGPRGRVGGGGEGACGSRGKAPKTGKMKEGAGPITSLPRGHLGQAPRSPRRRGGQLECLSAGPDFSAQPSSRNARAAPGRQRPQLRIRGSPRRGSRLGSAPPARPAPPWLPPTPPFPRLSSLTMERGPGLTRSSPGFLWAPVLVTAVGGNLCPLAERQGVLDCAWPAAPSAVRVESGMSG